MFEEAQISAPKPFIFAFGIWIHLFSHTHVLKQSLPLC